MKEKAIYKGTLYQRSNRSYRSPESLNEKMNHNVRDLDWYIEEVLTFENMCYYKAYKGCYHRGYKGLFNISYWPDLEDINEFSSVKKFFMHFVYDYEFDEYIHYIKK